jgi:hypothetical protein
VKCPGCGTELPEGSNFCNHCGGRILGSNVDYSHTRTPGADAFEIDSSQSAGCDPISEADEYFMELGWLRFAMALVTMPILAFISIVYGLNEKRAEFLVFGAVFAVLSVVAFIYYVKYTKNAGDIPEPAADPSSTKYMRRI